MMDWLFGKRKKAPDDVHEEVCGVELGKGLRASLLAGALGDAMGYEVEFDSLERIIQVHGKNGVSDIAKDIVPVSDDTQMTMFAMEGILLEGDEEKNVWEAFGRWYDTQSSRFENGKGLLGFRSMYVRQAPGNTCLTALSRGKMGLPFGTVDCAINESKGCGGVMRSMPFGFAAETKEQAFEWGCGQAAMTHGHIDGWLPAGILSSLVFSSAGEESLCSAIEDLLAWFATTPFASTRTVHLLRKVVDRKDSRVEQHEIPDIFGEGWTGDEALAIGLWSVLNSKSFDECLMKSVNHDGDSDSTGSIAGNLWGAWYGLPASWEMKSRRLDVHEAMQYVLSLWEKTKGVPV